MVTGGVVLLVAGKCSPDLYVGSAELGQRDAGTSVHFLGGAMTVSLYCLHLLITELSQIGPGLYPSSSPAHPSPLSLLIRACSGVVSLVLVPIEEYSSQKDESNVL